jgi:predicted DNA-binding protein (MmcQ/YjbR family)
MTSENCNEFSGIMDTFEKTKLTMNIEELREYCLSKKGATEHFPFDETTLVFKVMGKMFALTDLEGPLSLNLKCDPEKAIDLREKYPSVQPGYHMNKKHWNSVSIDGSVDDKLICQWIDHSYKLIVKSLSNKLKSELEKL